MKCVFVFGDKKNFDYLYVREFGSGIDIILFGETSIRKRLTRKIINRGIETGQFERHYLTNYLDYLDSNFQLSEDLVRENLGDNVVIKTYEI